MTTSAPSASNGHGDRFKPNSKELLEGKAPTQQYFFDEYAKEDWVAPWDIGKAQTSLIQAEREGLLKGEVCEMTLPTQCKLTLLASKECNRKGERQVASLQCTYY